MSAPAQEKPTLGQVMRRPKWIAALLAVLAVAAFFAFLAQWQLSHAIRLDDEQLLDTETPVDLYEVTKPGEAVTEISAGRMVEVSGVLQMNDLAIVSQRVNGDKTGYWVVGRAEVVSNAAETGAITAADNLAVAIGWSPDIAGARAALQRLQAENVTTTYELPILTGRYSPTEAPEKPQKTAGETVYKTLAPAQQLNVWQGVNGELPEQTFAGYLVLAGDNAFVEDARLAAIDSAPPAAPEKINWLNLFYALEWVVFAGFAVYFWVRLCKDAQEKEIELLSLAREQQTQANQQNELPENSEE